MLNERLLLLNLRDVKSVSYRNVDYKVYLDINYYNGEPSFAYNADFSDLAHKDYQVEKVRKVYEAIAESIKKRRILRGNKPISIMSTPAVLIFF